MSRYTNETVSVSVDVPVSDVLEELDAETIVETFGEEELLEAIGVDKICEVLSSAGELDSLFDTLKENGDLSNEDLVDALTLDSADDYECVAHQLGLQMNKAEAILLCQLIMKSYKPVKLDHIN